MKNLISFLFLIFSQIALSQEPTIVVQKCLEAIQLSEEDTINTFFISLDNEESTVKGSHIKDEAHDFFGTICMNSNTYQKLRNNEGQDYKDYYALTSPAFEILNRDGEFERLKFEEFKDSNYILFEEVKSNKIIARVYVKSREGSGLKFKLVKLDQEGWKIFEVERSSANVELKIERNKPVFTIAEVTPVPPLDLAELYTGFYNLDCIKNGRNYFQVVIETDGTVTPYNVNSENKECLNMMCFLINRHGKWKPGRDQYGDKIRVIHNIVLNVQK